MKNWLTLLLLQSLALLPINAAPINATPRHPPTTGEVRLIYMANRHPSAETPHRLLVKRGSIVSTHLLTASGSNALTEPSGAPPAAAVVTAPSFYDWLFQTFPNASLSPDDDPNGHGIPLLARYFFGLDPHHPDQSGSPAVLLQSTPEGETVLTIQYNRRQEHDVGVVIEASSDLVDWEPLDSGAEVEVVPNGVLETVTVRDPVSSEDSDKRFMRITLTPPPHPGKEETPTDVEVERMSRLRARITWDSTGADSYSVQRKPAGGAWSEIDTVSSPSFIDDSPRARGTTYAYRVVARTDGRYDSDPSPSVETTVPAIRLTMIGDSNLQRGADERDRVVVKSYVGNGSKPAIDPDDYLDHPSLISGRIMLLRPDIEATNHGIDGTESGTGLGNTDRANALRVIDGYTRFEGEMLGKDYPWKEEGIKRVNAFAPSNDDYGYYSFGVNDIHDGVSPSKIRSNIATAIDLWEASGLSASKLMIATISPRPEGDNQENVPEANERIRDLVDDRGAILIDTAELVSNDDGLSWKGSKYHTDGIHFSDFTCDRIANEIVSKIPMED